MKRSIILFQLLLILLTFFSLYSCQSNQQSNNQFNFVPTDTIIIPSNNIGRQISVFDKKTNTNKLFYFDYKNNCFVKMETEKIVRKINFDSLFSKPGKLRLMRHFYYLGHDNFIYFLAEPIVLRKTTNRSLEIKWEFYLLKIDSSNSIVDTLKITNNTGMNFVVQSPLFQLPIQSNNDSDVFINAVAVFSQPGEKANNDYHINTKSRMSMFSQDYVMLLVIKNNEEAYFVSQNIIYPKIFLDTNISFYNYFPSIVGGRNQDILTLFYDLDTLYTYNVASATNNSYLFNSRHKTKFQDFDKSKIFDYEYINKSACESSSYIYMKQNRKSNQTYIIVKKAIKYENNDGTVNKASENPFSIIVLDTNYSQIGEFDIPNEYIKHYSFTYNNGLALLNSKLTNQDTNDYVHFVIFELQKEEK